MSSTCKSQSNWEIIEIIYINMNNLWEKRSKDENVLKELFGVPIYK